SKWISVEVQLFATIFQGSPTAQRIGQNATERADPASGADGRRRDRRRTAAIVPGVRVAVYAQGFRGDYTRSGAGGAPNAGGASLDRALRGSHCWDLI